MYSLYNKCILSVASEKQHPNATISKLYECEYKGGCIVKTAVKKVLCLWICTVLAVLQTPWFAIPSAAVQVSVGDVNDDDQINVGDVARLYAHFQGQSLVGQDAMTRADLDDSGWLYPSYVQKLYDKTRFFTLQDIIAVVSQLPENTVHSDPVTVEGKVVSVRESYNPEYKNISVMLQVDGTNEQLLCYRMTGPRAEAICVEDSITVTGFLRNYRGEVEFAAGCQGTIKRRIGTAQDYNAYLEELNSYLPLGVSPRTAL